MQMDDAGVVLEGRNICRTFGAGRRSVHAVRDASFSFRNGEVISLVGESGSGKTTLAKMLLALLAPTSGELLFDGRPADIRSTRGRRDYWRIVQGIFQDPFSSFNQFFKVEKILMDCLRMKGARLTRDEAFREMERACTFVNLEFGELYNKYPFELSGGQMQRMMIARIFMVSPRLLIADEPTSMIDACSRSTIMDMLLKLREEHGMTILFITHDLGLAYYISDTIMIMEKGRIVESGPARKVISCPEHPYTCRLLEDVPKLHERWL